MKITQERLKEVLAYNPDTGIFKWKVNKASVARKGCAAGSLNCKGYIAICIDFKIYRAARLAFLYMKGYFPCIVDHIDRDRSNNRWNNLREATSQINLRNKKRSKYNTSGITGVYFSKQKGKWRASISSNGRENSFGDYLKKHDAICARYCAELKYNWHTSNATTDAKIYIENYFRD